MDLCLWKVELLRGGRCWSESHTYLVRADSQEEAIDKVLIKHRANDPNTFHANAEDLGVIDFTIPLEIASDYYDG